MLITQIAATHVAMTTLSQKMMDAGSGQMRASCERSVSRLGRTYLAQMEALKKYRAKAQQTVRVERVTVNEGGQAIVGDVTHGGGVLAMESDGNLIDPTQRLRNSPRCTATAKRTGQRCQCPSKHGWSVCRLHGAGGGAPTGTKHPNYKHGMRSNSVREMRQMVRILQLSLPLD